MRERRMNPRLQELQRISKVPQERQAKPDKKKRKRHIPTFLLYIRHSALRAFPQLRASPSQNHYKIFHIAPARNCTFSNRPNKIFLQTRVWFRPVLFLQELPQVFPPLRLSCRQVLVANRLFFSSIPRKCFHSERPRARKRTLPRGPVRQRQATCIRHRNKRVLSRPLQLRLSQNNIHCQKQMKERKQIHPKNRFRYSCFPVRKKDISGF